MNFRFFIGILYIEIKSCTKKVFSYKLSKFIHLETVFQKNKTLFNRINFKEHFFQQLKPEIMKAKQIITTFCLFLVAINFLSAQKNFEKDTIKTTKGDLIMLFIGHGTLMFEINNKIIHIDPTSREADYSTMPKADLILVTHEHGDHLDWSAIEKIKTTNTQLIMTETCAESTENPKNITVMKNGDKQKTESATIEAVPAYNIKHKRSNGKAFHPKGIGNGYVLTIGKTKIYIAGDTENIPEMKNLKKIDIAFLPMNLPYTMTPEMVADASKLFEPKVLYPYHYGKTNTDKLVELMKNNNKTEVRIRQLQ